jgi:hypothetical protein
MQNNISLPNHTNTVNAHPQDNGHAPGSGERVRWLIVLLSMLGVLVFLLTREVWVIVACTRPLPNRQEKMEVAFERERHAPFITV